MLGALDFYLDRAKEIVIVSARDGDARPLLETLGRSFVPNRVVVATGESAVGGLAALAPVAAGKIAIGGKATAPGCEAIDWDLPTAEPAVRAAHLPETGAVARAL